MVIRLDSSQSSEILQHGFWEPMPHGIAEPIGGSSLENPLTLSLGTYGSKLELFTQHGQSSSLGARFVDGRTGNVVTQFYNDHFNLIGRSTLHCTDPSVSRIHLAVLRDEAAGAYYVVDLHSLSGTFVFKNRESLAPSASHFYGLTDPGRQRGNNEDSFYMNPAIADNPAFFLVADGVGGEVASEKASIQTVLEVSRCIASGEDIATAVDSAHHFIMRQGHAGKSTLVGAVEFAPNQYQVFGVGDSPAILVDLNKNSFRHLLMRDEEARPEDGKMVLTAVVGSGDHDHAPHQSSLTLQTNQYLLLCTDGFSDYLEKNKQFMNQTLSILRSDQPLQQKTEALVALANQFGGKDNITLILLSPH